MLLRNPTDKVSWATRVNLIETTSVRRIEPTISVDRSAIAPGKTLW
ncbi:hypothetical protein [Rubinisphaera italica]|nr:hypothetical protein [Rubinisphaera italica]